MNLFLFLVWLQMSAPPQTLSDGVNFSTASQCQEGLAIYITGKDGKSDEIAKCVNGYYERVPSAKTLIDDRPTHRGIIQPTLLEKEWGSEGNGGADLSTHFLAQEFAEAAQRAADETDGKPPHTHSPAALDGQYRNPEYKKPTEPVDVPAFYSKKQVPRDGPHRQCRSNEGSTSGYCWDREIADEGYTCKDKSRILEHDENSPPKYWCRKVQP